MKREKVLEAILTIAVALLALRFVFDVPVLMPAAIGLMLVALFSRWLSAKIVWMWFRMSEAMGFVMSRVILSIVFFLFLFPLSVLYRLFNKDALKLLKKGNSTYTDRRHVYAAKDLENPW